LKKKIENKKFNKIVLLFNHLIIYLDHVKNIYFIILKYLLVKLKLRKAIFKEIFFVKTATEAEPQKQLRARISPSLPKNSVSYIQQGGFRLLYMF